MTFGTIVAKTAIASGLLGALIAAPVAMANEGKGRSAEAHAKVELRKSERAEKVKPAAQVRSHATISASGKVHLIGATVTAVSGTILTATTRFASTSVSWTINTVGAKFGGKATTTPSVVVGDTINVGGTIGTSLTSINAKTVREVSR
jgi:hypothetical protein